MSTGTQMQVYEETDGGEIVAVQQVEMNALEALTRAEIDVQIATAHRFPRSIKRFHAEARQIACLNPQVAGKCFYTLPRKDRDGKNITGPSVRLAEIVAYSFGNLRVSSRITQESERFLVAQATALDLERNNGVQIEVRRRITKSNGKRYDDDMITTTANSALSFAYRNGVFRVVPVALVKPIEMEARKLAVGEGRSIEESRSNALTWARSLGVTPAEFYAFLEIPGLEDLSLEHLETLAGIRTALKDGETTIDEVFRPQRPEGGASGASRTTQIASDIERRTSKAKDKEPVAAAAIPEGGETWEVGRE